MERWNKIPLYLAFSVWSKNAEFEKFIADELLEVHNSGSVFDNLSVFLLRLHLANRVPPAISRAVG